MEEGNVFCPGIGFVPIADYLVSLGWRQIAPDQWESPDSPKIYTRAEALEAAKDGF